MRSICSLSIHDRSVSEADVLVNPTLFPPGSTVIAGHILQLAAVSQSPPAHGPKAINQYDGQQDQTVNVHAQAALPMGSTANHEFEEKQPVNPKKGYYFVVKSIDRETSSKIAGVHVRYSSTSVSYANKSH